MYKKTLFFAINLFLLIITPVTARALPASTFATTSRLATGKWVKIAIHEDGMYQITYEELAQMGFNNPRSVRLYGSGGHPISETLDGSAHDDLVPVPCKHYENKIYFYGCGPIQYYNAAGAQSSPRFSRIINSYSSTAYYFITSDDGTPKVEPSNITYGITGTKLRDSSIDYFHHEQDLTSKSQSGKDMLGEDLINNTLDINYSLVKPCVDSAMIINPCVAAKGKSNSYVSLKLNNNTIDLSGVLHYIEKATSQYVFYNSTSPSIKVDPENNSAFPENGTLTIGLDTPNEPVKWAKLDYMMLTYHHYNNLKDIPFNQMRMGFDNVSSTDIIAINSPTTTTELWNIDNPQTPKNYTLNYRENYGAFTPLYLASWTQFIAFDPAKELKSIDGFETVDNQNIHALPVPDMVIVTCDKLMAQAQRLAQLHRDKEKMTVHVLDQQKIFNEFSSGTPDAMAIRLMNKMFYDRDNNSKFKYLIMFGAGSYDNRQILAKNDYAILTYESTASNDENSSYVCDDFFGLLDDNSGKSPASDMLRLEIGRIPCTTPTEAESDVDKIINYVNNPDYGPWRNNILLIADYLASDSNMHAYQAEGVGNVIYDELNAKFARNKVFISQFPRDPISNHCVEGRRSLNLELQAGQYFMTYVGHANGTTLTKTANLWTTIDSKNANNQHLPIVTTACCDVARYDGNQRGLMEVLFHNPNGGAIAMMASTRAAYANGNDALNKAFVRAMFCYDTKGYLPTIGEAYKLAKQSFGTTSNYNKMMFSLLGDPAIKVNYPKPLFSITKINNQTPNPDYIVATAMQETTVEANVLLPNSTEIDKTFNGDATLTIYDYQKKEVTENNRDIFFPRQILTQINGRVVNGKFVAKAIIPRFILSPGAKGLVTVYAHRDNSDEMVNGSYDNLIINSYNENSSNTVRDNTPPSIDAIYFDDEELFDMYSQASPSSTLFIKATDDVAINTQTSAIGNGMEITIDNGKMSIPNVQSYTSVSNNGKDLFLHLPMDLTPGEHSLQCTLYDVAGNKTTKNIFFLVGSVQHAALTVEQEPATRVATFNFSSILESTPEVEIKLFDYNGVMRWHKTQQSFPFDWNLKVGNKKLPPGVYKFYGKYNDGQNYGSTPIRTLVIADDPQYQ